MKEIVVALSGTLETFSLPDVLRLLSSTKKTGLLALDGDRGRGRIWVRDGAIVAADADRAANDQLAGVAFELLRFDAADFEFESGAEAPVDGDARDVDEVLAEAESRLAEWRDIEAVVPSLGVWVRMVAEVDDERVVTPTQWRVLAQVGTGSTGHALGDRLGQGEYDVCRQLRDLVQEGMVELAEAPVAHDVPAGVVPVFGVDAAWDAPAEATFVEPGLDPEDVSALGADLASFVAEGTEQEAVPVDFREPAPAAEAEVELEAELEVGQVPAAWSVPEVDGELAEPTSDPEPADDEDVLSQLSELSPKAAAAVEATWGEAPSLDAADEQSAADEADEEVAAPADVDQNLLLRFLSSAKG